MSWYRQNRTSGLEGMIQYDMSAIRLMPDGPEQQCGAVSRRSTHMKRKSTLQLIVILLAVMIALFSFTACDDNPNAPPETGEEQTGNPDDNPNAPETGEEQTGNPDDNPPVLSDEEALKGQWFVYWLDDETQEMEFGHFVIDIQYTELGYWIMAYMPDISDPIAYSKGPKTQSNRTLREDGWFFISVPEAEEPFEIRYRFSGSDRNTLEAELRITGAQGVDRMELRRVVGKVIEIIEGPK